MVIFSSLTLVFGFVAGNFATLVSLAVIYLVVATVLAKMLGWGDVGFYEIDGVLVLKIPGGGLLASLPIPETIMLWLVLILNPVLGQVALLVALGLSFFMVLRLLAFLIVHIFSLVGSRFASTLNLGFSIECMDSRCYHGSRSGNFLHNWACGGFTLLTALGFAPLIIFPVLLGSFFPGGLLGILLLVPFCLPYLFFFAKLKAKNYSDTKQVSVKGFVDIIMFPTEIFGWMIGSITLSIVSLRAMWPGITSTRIH